MKSPLALAAQLLIAAYSAVDFVLAADGGTRSRYFPYVIPLFVATIVVFLCWLHRCRRNAEVLAPGSQKHDQGLAVGAWFIPLANWWIPRQVVLDIRRASSPSGSVWLVNAWWAAWLAKSAAGLAGPVLSPQAHGFSSYELAANTVAAVLAILMIHQVTAGQVPAADAA